METTSFSFPFIRFPFRIPISIMYFLLINVFVAEAPDFIRILEIYNRQRYNCLLAFYFYKHFHLHVPTWFEMEKGLFN